jgi:hypothetical protein
MIRGVSSCGLVDRLQQARKSYEAREAPLADGGLTIGCRGCGALHTFGRRTGLRGGPASLTLVSLGRRANIAAIAGDPLPKPSVREAVHLKPPAADGTATADLRVYPVTLTRMSFRQRHVLVDYPRLSTATVLRPAPHSSPLIPLGP